MRRVVTASAGRSVAAVATAAVALFPLIVIGLNLVQHDRYSATRQAISELALGSGGALMAVAFCGLGLGIALLALVVRSTQLRWRMMPLLLASAAVLAGPVSAAFHTDRSGAKTTLHGAIHNVAGFGAFVLILAAMVCASVQFRRDAFWRGAARTTAALTVLAIGTFLLIPALGNDDFGLAQRLFVGTFVTWLLTTTGYAHRRARCGYRTLVGSGGASSSLPVRSSLCHRSRIP